MAATAIEIINIAVANPFVLNTAWRNGTITYKAITAINPSFPICDTDTLFLFDNPKWRGNKKVVAKGQTFRHTPVATTNNAGATGIKIFQNNSTPIGGKNNKQTKIAVPTNQTAACAIRQIKTEREDI